MASFADYIRLAHRRLGVPAGRRRVRRLLSSAQQVNPTDASCGERAAAPAASSSGFRAASAFPITNSDVARTAGGPRLARFP